VPCAVAHSKRPVISFLITQQYQSILHAFKRGWKTVRAMDILFPERNVGGSQREERFDVLVKK
jgi:aspartyl/asparaginyl-tRNA synthetase